MKKRVTILGSTGSIGQQTLQVIAQNAEYYAVHALTACTNHEKLFTQCQQFSPYYAVLTDEQAARILQRNLKQAGLATEVLVGTDALVQVAGDKSADVIVGGIVGAAGLLPSLAAAKTGKRLLLANKEALVMSGDVFMQTIQEAGTELLPVDSEHNAILQCLPDHYLPGCGQSSGLHSMVLTASGGPFRCLPLEQFADITPKAAIAHPNWSMGPKISVDSATMLNKGLEVIEAHFLFNMPIEAIQVIIHPQSIVHSMVRYIDGSTLAQMGYPDMRTPIANALGWPKRIASGVANLDLVTTPNLEFSEVEMTRYPCLALAYAALKAGGSATCALNAANEIAVSAFFDRKIKFTHIASVIEHVLNTMSFSKAHNLNDVLVADEQARQLASEKVNNYGVKVTI